MADISTGLMAFFKETNSNEAHHLTSSKLEFLKVQAQKNHEIFSSTIQEVVAGLKAEADKAACALTELNDNVLNEFLEECEGYEHTGSSLASQLDRVENCEQNIRDKLKRLTALLSDTADSRSVEDIAQNKVQLHGMKVWDAESYLSPVKQLRKDLYLQQQQQQQSKRPRLDDSFDVKLQDASSEEEDEDGRMCPCVDFKEEQEDEPEEDEHAAF